MFDEKYWSKTDKSRPQTCSNCGHQVIELKRSSTGYTHTGTWEGIRCQNMLCGATPVKR